MLRWLGLSHRAMARQVVVAHDEIMTERARLKSLRAELAQARYAAADLERQGLATARTVRQWERERMREKDLLRRIRYVESLIARLESLCDRYLRKLQTPRSSR